MGIHAYLFGQLFAQCRTAYINTHAALLMVDMLGSIPKGSHCNTSHLYCLGCTLQIMYHENTRLGESSISRHKARSGGFGTFSLECGADIQPGTSWALAALDRPSNGRIADLSAKSNGLTQIPGVMWEVASLSEPVTEWGPPRIGTAG